MQFVVLLLYKSASKMLKRINMIKSWLLQVEDVPFIVLIALTFASLID